MTVFFWINGKLGEYQNSNANANANGDEVGFLVRNPA
jgi:hypothetical protein